MNKKKTGLFKPEDIDFDTKILDFIIAIADEGGLSKAAEALYLSQPALSRYLKAVETSLGTPIFFSQASGTGADPCRKSFYQRGQEHGSSGTGNPSKNPIRKTK